MTIGTLRSEKRVDMIKRRMTVACVCIVCVTFLVCVCRVACLVSLVMALCATVAHCLALLRSAILCYPLLSSALHCFPLWQHFEHGENMTSLSWSEEKRGEHLAGQMDLGSVRMFLSLHVV